MLFDNLKHLLRKEKRESELPRVLPQTLALTLECLLLAETEPQRYAELPLRYRLTEKLGDGAFSTVFKAHDRQTNSAVAVKVIDKRAALRQQIEQVLKEISIMRRVRHPNVVRLVDFKDTPSYCFLVMEHVAGGELFNQIIHLTYLSEPLARHVIVQVARAVQYLHDEVGVVHRDIKPENLLFEPVAVEPRDAAERLAARRASDDDTKRDEGRFCPGSGGGGIGTVKLADFGLSKVLWDRLTQTPCGTAGYTAPEIMADQTYDKGVDVWLLGCVLYTLLCGFPPFYDSDPRKLARRIVKCDYCFLAPWWDEVLQEAKDLVLHLLTKDPAERYTIEQMMAHPWITQEHKPTKPAVDAPPPTTFVPGVFAPQYFAEDGTHTPRAEAIRFAFNPELRRDADTLAAVSERSLETSLEGEEGGVLKHRKTVLLLSTGPVEFPRLPAPINMLWNMDAAMASLPSLGKVPRNSAELPLPSFDLRLSDNKMWCRRKASVTSKCV